MGLVFTTVRVRNLSTKKSSMLVLNKRLKRDNLARSNIVQIRGNFVNVDVKFGLVKFRDEETNTIYEIYRPQDFDLKGYYFLVLDVRTDNNSVKLLLRLDDKIISNSTSSNYQLELQSRLLVRNKGIISSLYLFPLNNIRIYGEITQTEYSWIINEEYEKVIFENKRPFNNLFFLRTKYEYQAWLVWEMTRVMITRKKAILDKIDLKPILPYLDYHQIKIFDSKYFYLFKLNKTEEEKVWLREHNYDEDLTGIMFTWVKNKMIKQDLEIKLRYETGRKPIEYIPNCKVYVCDPNYPIADLIHKKKLPVTLMNWKNWENQIYFYPNVVIVTDKEIESLIETNKNEIYVHCEYFKSQNELFLKDDQVYRVHVFEKDVKLVRVENEKKKITRDQLSKEFISIGNLKLSDLLWLPDKCIPNLILRRCKDNDYFHAAYRVTKNLIYHVNT